MLRQRSSISFSLASVLCTRANNRIFCPKTPCQGPRARLAAGAVWIRQEVERGFKAERFILAFDREFQTRHRFIEKPVPRGGPDGGLVMQKFLQLVRKLVRPHGPHPLEDRAIPRKVMIGVQLGVEFRVGNAIQFQREKDKRGRCALVTRSCASDMALARAVSAVFW